MIVPVLWFSVQAAADDSWTGKRIMSKSCSLDIRSGEEVIGKTKSFLLTVLRVDGD